MVSGESTAELVYGEEPWNNGDYSWCDNCKAYVFIEYWEERIDENGLSQYFHRGHPMDNPKQ